MIVLAIGIPGDPRGAGWLHALGEIIHEQGDDRLRAGDKPGGIYPEVEMIFHIMHGPMHTLMEPGFQPPGVFIQRDGFGYTAKVETQLMGPFLDQGRMLIF